MFQIFNLDLIVLTWLYKSFMIQVQFCFAHSKQAFPETPLSCVTEL